MPPTNGPGFCKYVAAAGANALFDQKAADYLKSTAESQGLTLPMEDAAGRYIYTFPYLLKQHQSSRIVAQRNIVAICKVLQSLPFLAIDLSNFRDISYYNAHVLLQQSASL